MYGVMKMIIGHGEYKLEDMVKRIDALYAKGRIGLEEMDELKEMARENAKAENSYAPLQEQVNKAFELIDALAQRVVALEGNSGSSGGGGDTAGGEWPDYEQPTGAHDAYYAGMQMTYTDGKHYTCIAPEGVACVWGPDVMPGYWQEVTNYGN